MKGPKLSAEDVRIMMEEKLRARTIPSRKIYKRPKSGARFT